jgi:sulfatase modifying factor 1
LRWLGPRPPSPAAFEKAAAPHRAKTEALHAAADAAALTAYIDEHDAWRNKSVRLALSAAQHGKCAFCETPLTQYRPELEHFRPKNRIDVLKTVGEEPLHGYEIRGRTVDASKAVVPGYWWRAYDWSNYALSCNRCNGAWKKTFFPTRPAWERAPQPGEEGHVVELLLDPFVDDPLPHLRFHAFGEVTAAPDSERGQPTIDTLGLNREPLRHARLRDARVVTSLCDRILAAVAAGQLDRDLVAQLVAYGDDTAPFAGMVRCIACDKLGLGAWNEVLRLAEVQPPPPRPSALALHEALRTVLAARTTHLRLATLTVDQTAPGRATWRAELEVGSLAAAFEAQLELIGRFGDLKTARLSPDGVLVQGTRVTETGDVAFEVRGDGTVDEASLRFRSHLFEDLAAMVPIKEPRGIANGAHVELAPYHMGKFQVTQALYEIVAGDNPSHFKGDSQRPVEQVSWYDAVRFCNALSQLTGRSSAYLVGDGDEPAVAQIEHAEGFRMPREAEWEVAHRAGVATHFFWGDDPTAIDRYAWHIENAGGVTHAVGTKSPNRNGLHDTAGNVREWTTSVWEGDDDRRIARGASWWFRPELMRSTDRTWRLRGFVGSSQGFRVAYSPPPAPWTPLE